ncbi:MAG: UDP-N-acetylglucosamine 1-carboxyvinyltransferase [Rickettsiaceae bacterium]|nr:MAG: UDP-N-acetylglucosamine 1-carboxyvinyltransferase [Rickettsiaceae bacterium]
MDSIVIKGGTPLQGIVKINGAKNAALPIMAAALLTADRIVLTNIPKLTDVETMNSLLRHHGAIVSSYDQAESLELHIDCSKITDFIAPYEIVRKMRASIWVLGPLLARFGEAKISLPGGCAIGARQVDMHISVLEAMNAHIEIEQGYIKATSKGQLKGTHFNFHRISVGATITAILAASLAEGETSLTNCAKEPEIVDLCKYLCKMGAKIKGAGTAEIKIMGVSSLKGVTYDVMPDRIEAGTYMIAAAITKGELDIVGIDYKIVENLVLKLLESGTIVTRTNSGINVRHSGVIKPTDINTEEYPGFATDLQAQFMSLLTIADGASVITENIFENRYMHVPELNRMGANIIIKEHNAIIKGVKYLKGAEVMASDLRASSCLILAALAATGETRIGRVYHLDRGYQAFEHKLSSCGADIMRIRA